MLWQVGERLGFAPPPGMTGRAPSTSEEEGAEFGKACAYFLTLLEQYFTFEEGFKRFKFYLRMVGGWLEFGHYLFASTSKAKDYAEVRAAVEKFFAVPQSMALRTHLRE